MSRAIDSLLLKSVLKQGCCVLLCWDEVLARGSFSHSASSLLVGARFSQLVLACNFLGLTGSPWSVQLTAAQFLPYLWYSPKDPEHDEA